MKKCLSILLAASLLLTMAACGKKQPPKETQPGAVSVLPLPPVEDPTMITTQPETESTETTVPETEPPETTEPETVPPTTEKEVGEPGKVVNTNSLNVREKPGASSKLVTTLKGGTQVTVYEQITYYGSKWGRIDQGWVSMSYILLDSVANSYWYNHTEKPTTEPTEEETTEATDPKPTDPKPTDPTTKPDEGTDEGKEPVKPDPDEKPGTGEEGGSTPGSGESGGTGGGTDSGNGGSTGGGNETGGDSKPPVTPPEPPKTDTPPAE